MMYETIVHYVSCKSGLFYDVDHGEDSIVDDGVGVQSSRHCVVN